MRIVTLLLTLLFNAPLWAALMAISTEKGKVTFEAIGRPSMLKVKGEGEGLQSALSLDNNKVSGEVLFDLERLDTDIALRDDHMKNKYLEVGKYPKAKLKIQDLTVPGGFKVTDTIAKQTFKGSLELHGVTRDVTGEFTLADQKISAKFDIKLSDFKIDIPSYMGITIADVVKVEVQTQLAAGASPGKSATTTKK